MVYSLRDPYFDKNHLKRALKCVLTVSKLNIFPTAGESGTINHDHEHAYTIATCDAILARSSFCAKNTSYLAKIRTRSCKFWKLLLETSFHDHTLEEKTFI